MAATGPCFIPNGVGVHHASLVAPFCQHNQLFGCGLGHQGSLCSGENRPYPGHQRQQILDALHFALLSMVSRRGRSHTTLDETFNIRCGP